MAFSTEYTKSITTLEGNTLVFDLEEDGGAGASNNMDITSNSFEIEYFFNDIGNASLGIGYLSKTITLEFYESDEIDDILTNPEDWRLTITLDSNTIFVGFPDVHSINEYILPDYSSVYRCDFVNKFSSIVNASRVTLSTATSASANSVHASNKVPITDLIGEFIIGENTGLTKDVFVSHLWQSENCIQSGGIQRGAPHLRYTSINPNDTSGNKVGELIAEICKGWMCRVGYSHTDDNTIISHHLDGAGGSLSGYDCAYTASGYRGSSSRTITLQSLAADGSDFIINGSDLNADNPLFPARVTSQIGTGSKQISSNSQTALSAFFENDYEISSYWLDDTRCTIDNEGITVFGRDAGDTVDADDVIGNVNQVDPSSLGTNYTLASATTKRTGEDYLFTKGLKGFRVPVNKVLDPMIPITYNSKVYITPEGVINLMDETTDCLLTEIQDNG